MPIKMNINYVSVSVTKMTMASFERRLLMVKVTKFVPQGGACRLLIGIVISGN